MVKGLEFCLQISNAFVDGFVDRFRKLFLRFFKINNKMIFKRKPLSPIMQYATIFQKNSPRKL